MNRERLSISRCTIYAGLVVAGLLLLIHPQSVSMSATVPQVGADARPKPTPKKSVPPARTVHRSPTRTNSGAGNTTAVEIAFWNSIKDSTNPEDFREYLRKYPNGEFTGLARHRLDALEAAAKEDAARKEEAKKAEDRRKEREALKRPGAVVKDSIGMELVYVPAGSFLMGSENGSDVEKPAHQVTIREGFHIGRYEVTQAQWQAVMGNNPSKFKGCDQCPVEQVSWAAAQEFINKLNEKSDGFEYRLPSESEWEYTCRAGTTGDYAGNLDLLAWYKENSGDKPHPVGQKQPNGFGLYDMHGNVWEWCLDYYHATYAGAPTDGSAWLVDGDSKSHVLRGGAWYNGAGSCRSALRNRSDPKIPFTSLVGFRVVAVARSS